MSKVTSKLQVTIPKTLAERFDIRPGDEILWEEAGAYIRIVPLSARRRRRQPVAEDRVWIFDQATARQEARERELRRAFPDLGKDPGLERGWTREELYTRGSSD